MSNWANQADYQIEYLHQIIESDEDAGVQIWLQLFKSALDQSRFHECEQMLLVARRSPSFSSSPVLRSVILHNEGLLRLFQDRLDEAEGRFQKALASYRRVGDRFNEAQCLTA